MMLPLKIFINYLLWFELHSIKIQSSRIFLLPFISAFHQILSLSYLFLAILDKIQSVTTKNPIQFFFCLFNHFPQNYKIIGHAISLARFFRDVMSSNILLLFKSDICPASASCFLHFQLISLLHILDLLKWHSTPQTIICIRKAVPDYAAISKKSKALVVLKTHILLSLHVQLRSVVELCSTQLLKVQGCMRLQVVISPCHF